LTVFQKIFALLALLAFVLVAVDTSSAVADTFSPPVGAPGPIAGAGLPILAIGFGAYWLVKRLRRKPD
jgi:hypothetical protein